MGLNEALIPSTSTLRVPVFILANFKYNDEELEHEVEVVKDVEYDPPGVARLLTVAMMGMALTMQLGPTLEVMWRIQLIMSQPSK